jgi:pimeloyl-ACP methyl ester carboxylesterase
MLSWYRAALRGRLPKLPPVLARSLCIWGDRDPALGPRLAEHLDRYAHDIEVRHIADAGHWVQQEQPAEVSRLILEFLGRA